MRTSLRRFGAGIALSLVGNAFCASSQYQVVKPDLEAVTVATKFLSVVDAGNYTETFAMFPARIRSGGDAFEKNWVSYLNVKRAPLGRMVSRKLVKGLVRKDAPWISGRLLRVLPLRHFVSAQDARCGVRGLN
jgi:hypothetical protein